MKDPRDIQPIEHDGIIIGFRVPQYRVSNDGLVGAGTTEILFCKGNKEDESVFRQSGLFTETILEVAKQFLENVNVGELASRETSMAITKLDESQMWLGKRAEDRKRRGVQGTYKS